MAQQHQEAQHKISMDQLSNHWRSVTLLPVPQRVPPSIPQWPGLVDFMVVWALLEEVINAEAPLAIRGRIIVVFIFNCYFWKVLNNCWIFGNCEDMMESCCHVAITQKQTPSHKKPRGGAKAHDWVKLCNYLFTVVCFRDYFLHAATLSQREPEWAVLMGILLSWRVIRSHGGTVVVPMPRRYHDSRRRAWADVSPSELCNVCRFLRRMGLSSN